MYVHLIYEGRALHRGVERVLHITNHQRNAKQNLNGTEACDSVYGKKMNLDLELTYAKKKSIPGDSKT